MKKKGKIRSMGEGTSPVTGATGKCAKSLEQYNILCIKQIHLHGLASICHTETMFI